MVQAAATFSFSFDKEGMNPIHHAVISENIKSLEDVIFKVESHYKISQRDLRGCAVDRRWLPVNFADDRGWSPIHYAAALGNEAMVSLLLKHGANANCFDEQGWTPMHLAVRVGSAAAIAALKEDGQGRINTQGNSYFTPLHEAVYNGAHEVLSVLFEMGADVEAADNYGQTPLALLMTQYTFSRSVCKEIEKNLLNQGASEQFVRQFLAQKIKASVLEVDGYFSLDGINCCYSGLTPAVSLRYFNMLLNDFFASEAGSCHSGFGETISDCFAHMEDKLNLSDSGNDAHFVRYKAGLPLLIASGTDDHDTVTILHKNTLFKCNRGFGRGETAIEIFEVPDTKMVSDKVIGKLRHRDPEEYCFTGVNDELNLRLQGGIIMKEHRGRHCSWSCLEAALAALCSIYGAEETLLNDFISYTKQRVNDENWVNTPFVPYWRLSN